MTAPSLSRSSAPRSFSLAAQEELQSDLARCREIVEHSGSSFRYAFYLLPRAQQDALCAVYAFCRSADDIADDAGVHDPEKRLEAWRREVERAHGGRPVHSIGRALSWAIDSFALPLEPFLELIDGVEGDLKAGSYETAEDLEKYCYRVASTVGLLCVRIFGAKRGRADRYAVELGKAFQLTNILRDLGEDAARARIYLPSEDLRDAACSPEALAARKESPEVDRLIAMEVARARHLYSQARAALPDDPILARNLAPAEAMHRIYQDLLDRVANAGSRVLVERIAVPAPRRAWLAASAWRRGARRA